MIFNQLFDDKSSTYTYVISSGKGREALIIDPVIEHTKKYIKILVKRERLLNGILLSNLQEFSFKKKKKKRQLN